MRWTCKINSKSWSLLSERPVQGKKEEESKRKVDPNDDLSLETDDGADSRV